MCGILGVCGFDESRFACDMEQFGRQLALLHHRGPDQDGLKVIDRNVVLGHKRLSLLDLSDAGVQPMTDASGRYTIVYNGEVYNHPQIRESLKAQGVRFVSGSDTETLLYHLAANHRDMPRAVSEWEGMFAFALYDREERSLFLALDRYGIKPLYYARRGDAFWFASEVKALLDVVEGRLDSSSFAEFLRVRFLESFRYTLIEGIERMEPGRWMKVHRDGRTESGVFFDLRSFVDPALYRQYSRVPFEQVAREFGDLFRQSVREHMLSDAPLATVNSGGVDSSTISAVAAAVDPEITMYHAHVRGKRTSELDAAQRIAGHLNGKLRVAPLDDPTWLRAVVQSVYYSEIPLVYHPNSVPFRLVCELMRRDGIKAVLTGEGADELLFGYETLVLKPYIDAAGRMLGRMHRAIHGTKLGSLLWPSPREPLVTRLQSRCWVEEEEQKNLDAYSFISDRKERAHQAGSMRYMRVHLYSVLHRNDRMGMAHSIESRFPFLHSAVVRFGFNLPVRHKVRWAPRILKRRHPFLVDKAPLRYFAADVIPREIAFRPKFGFPVYQQRRLRSRPEFFADGFLQNQFELTDAQFTLMLETLRGLEHEVMFFSEVWGRLYVLREPVEAVERRVQEHCYLRGG